MKVERDDKFKPITITLETEGEADALWHLLNTSTHAFKQKTDNAVEVFRGELSIQDTMWNMLDIIHRPPSKH